MQPMAAKLRDHPPRHRVVRYGHVRWPDPKTWYTDCNEKRVECCDVAITSPRSLMHRQFGRRSRRRTSLGAGVGAGGTGSTAAFLCGPATGAGATGAGGGIGRPPTNTWNPTDADGAPSASADPGCRGVSRKRQCAQHEMKSLLPHRMYVVTGAVQLVAVLCVVGQTQDPGAPLVVERLPCNFCHTCDNPTVRYPCLRLRACPRKATAAINKEPERRRGPDLVILNRLEELYLSVPFDHRSHADMADMMDGCAMCHHHTPEGAAHPACDTCHDTSPKGDDIRNPNLKAAFHRQCMSCHREWSGTTHCTACHPPRVGQEQDASTVEGILGTTHPPIPMPHTGIYESGSKASPGTKIIFRHKEHIDRFGLKCAHCHRENSCSRCHGERDEDEQSERAPAEHHARCSRCHDVENKAVCSECHWKEGEAKPKPFEHASTGWALDEHHVTLACRTCHKDVPFRKLDRDCNACHSDWSASSFDHAVTGQALDKDHEGADCANCHAARKFDRPPRCDECHEAGEGVVFPEKRPGRMVIPSHRESDLSSGGRHDRVRNE